MIDEPTHDGTYDELVLSTEFLLERAVEWEVVKQFPTIVLVPHLDYRSPYE